MTYPAKEIDGRYYVDIYLPARTAVVLKEEALPVRKNNTVSVAGAG